MSTSPRSTRTALLGAAATAAVLLLGACGGGAETEAPADDTSQSSEPSGGGGGGGGAGAEVSIVDNDFEPADTEVKTGGEVAWENTGESAHTVTFEDGEDSGNLDSGATYSRTFDEAGDFPYVCSIHPEMKGTVTVAE